MMGIARLEGTRSLFPGHDLQRDLGLLMTPHGDQVVIVTKPHDRVRTIPPPRR